MAMPDSRRVMSLAEFGNIPVDDDAPIAEQYDALIEENESIGDRFLEVAERLKELTTGQRLLIQLTIFDGQVENGGITQFFWNYPEWIFDVADGLEYLELPELEANYRRGMAALFGKEDGWLALREQWTKAGDNPRWETFQQSYELLDLGWFDDAYFDQYGDNERGEWVWMGKGLHHVLLTRLAEYIRTHRDEFITG